MKGEVSSEKICGTAVSLAETYPVENDTAGLKVAYILLFYSPV